MSKRVAAREEEFQGVVERRRVGCSVTDEGLARWQVSVTDEEAADSELLRLVLVDEQLKVMDWGRKKYQLEEIFLSLVEGDDSVR